MKDKVVLVTGASGALGSAVTEAFLSAGANVAGVSRTIREEQFSKKNFFAFPADITDSNTSREVVRLILERFGRIDVLVHVAGGFAAGALHETDEKTWAQMRELNLTSAYNMMHEVIPAMRRQKSGRIVVVGSLAAAEPRAGLAAYVTFKSALETLARIVALENCDAGITVNIVLPDTMDTPANRAAMPNVDPSKWVKTSEVAGAILLLASDGAANMNGAVVPIVTSSGSHD